MFKYMSFDEPSLEQASLGTDMEIYWARDEEPHHNVLPWLLCHYWHCPHTGVLLTASKITDSSLLLWDSPRQSWMKTVSQAPDLEETITGLRQRKGKINTLSNHFCEKWLWPLQQLQMNQPENTQALQTDRDCNHSKAGEVLRIPRPQKKRHTKNSAWLLNHFFKYQLFLDT